MLLKRIYYLIVTNKLLEILDNVWTIRILKILFKNSLRKFYRYAHDEGSTYDVSRCSILKVKSVMHSR